MLCLPRLGFRSGQANPCRARASPACIRSLKTFCRWLHREELVSRDLFAKITVPKEPILVVRTLSSAEAVAILKIARCGKYPLGDEALILFMFDTGARAAEVCGLDLTMINRESGLVRVFGKGQKERYVPIGPKTVKAMQR